VRKAHYVGPARNAGAASRPLRFMYNNMSYYLLETRIIYAFPGSRAIARVLETHRGAFQE